MREASILAGGEAVEPELPIGEVRNILRAELGLSSDMFTCNT